MSGGKLAQIARQSRPGLPILFISGFADLAAREDGMTETVLQKPFRAEELNAKVMAVLGQVAPRRPRRPATQRGLTEPLVEP
jgi:DNA-binding response OmpR family regulator